MEEETQEQSNNNRPWLFKKGQPSANPGGRPIGSKSLKTRAKEYLQGLSDEQAVEYFDGLNKLDVWKMAEGNPETKTDITTKGEKININPQTLDVAKKYEEEIKQALNVTRPDKHNQLDQ